MFRVGVQDNKIAASRLQMIADPLAFNGFYGIDNANKRCFHGSRVNGLEYQRGILETNVPVSVTLDCTARTLLIESTFASRLITDIDLPASLPAVGARSNQPVAWRLAVALDNVSATLVT